MEDVLVPAFLSFVYGEVVRASCSREIYSARKNDLCIGWSSFALLNLYCSYYDTVIHVFSLLFFVNRHLHVMW